MKLRLMSVLLGVLIVVSARPGLRALQADDATRLEQGVAPFETLARSCEMK